MADDEATGSTAAGTPGKGRKVWVAAAVAVALLAVIAVGVALGSGSDETAGVPAAGGTPTTATSPSEDGSATPSPPEDAPAAPSDTPDSTSPAEPSEPSNPQSEGTSPEETSPEVDDERATTIVCAATEAEYRDLANLAGAGTGVESVRDAAPVLQDRLRDLADAAEGRPELDGALELGESVLAAWQEAIAADDAGDEAVRDLALQRASDLFSEADRAVAASDVDPTDCL